MGRQYCAVMDPGGLRDEPGQMPWGMSYVYGMRCPACGEPMMKPSKQEIIEMLAYRKKRLEGVLDHINNEIARLKENKPEE